MVALMADGDDDATLIVVPAMGGDAGALAQLRARTVGGDQEARFNRAAVRQRHIDAVGAGIKAAHRGGAQIDAGGLGARSERIDQIAVFDHVREGLTGLDVAGKGQEHRTGGVFQLRIGDNHVEDGLCRRRDLTPDAERLEQSAAGGDDGGGAGVAARPDRQRWIGHDHGNVRAKTLAQRQRQRQSRKCPAADDNASLCRHTAYSHPCYLTIAERNRFEKQGATVIPGRHEMSNPESRDSGFTLPRAPE